MSFSVAWRAADGVPVLLSRVLFAAFVSANIASTAKYNLNRTGLSTDLMQAECAQPLHYRHDFKQANFRGEIFIRVPARPSSLLYPLRWAMA
jgi:hypothetical protein